MHEQAPALRRPILLVRDQVRESLDQAATHLERYHRDRARDADRARCQDLLHQVAGCLTMLELPGALRLVDEMRALAQALDNPRRLRHERCTELFISAALFLPRYLDYVRVRGHETPALLLPTINLMRFVRRAGLIPEHEIAPHRLPASDVLASPSCRTPADAARLPRIRQLRHQYQVGLLGVLRNHALDVHLRFLSHTLERLERLCGEQEPWQLAQGLLEALLAGSLTLDTSLKHMLGRLDRHIRQFAVTGTSSPAHAVDTGLRDHLLYYLAKAEPASERVGMLHVRYRLAGCVPGERYLEQERRWLQTPDRSATGAVAEVLLDDLAEVKNALLALQATGSPSDSLLRTLIRMLDQIALTLEVLGLDSAMRQCRGLARQLPGLVGGPASPALAHMAEQLVRIETTLRAYAQGVPGETLNLDHCDHLRLAEDNTLREAHQAISDIRRMLEEYFDPHAERHDRRDLSRDAAPLLHQVEGALQMLGLNELAELLRPLAQRLADPRSPFPESDTAELEAMAEAIASVEWFLDEYGQERRQPVPRRNDAYPFNS